MQTRLPLKFVYERENQSKILGLQSDVFLLRLETHLKGRAQKCIESETAACLESSAYKPHCAAFRDCVLESCYPTSDRAVEIAASRVQKEQESVLHGHLYPASSCFARNAAINDRCQAGYNLIDYFSLPHNHITSKSCIIHRYLRARALYVVQSMINHGPLCRIFLKTHILFSHAR